MTNGAPRSRRTGADGDLAAHEQRFWDLAGPLLGQPKVTRSTMIGLPCLRVDGAFFASWDRRTGALVVRLPEYEVDDLVASGRAEPFAPAGRRFREWAAIPITSTQTWPKLLERAHRHVSTLPEVMTQRKR
jgi:hypothetical protein